MGAGAGGASGPGAGAAGDLSSGAGAAGAGDGAGVEALGTPDSTTSTAGAGFGAAFFAAAFFAGASAAGGNASRSLRATGASTVDDGLLTYSPSSPSFSRMDLLVTPSSLASSWTRALPGTGLLREVGQAVFRRAR